jgi:hypothetical protein
MAKNSENSRKTGDRGVASKVLGASKARKFGLVEGVKLNARSKAASALTQSRGLKGDAYREEITGIFRDKRSK